MSDKAKTKTDRKSGKRYSPERTTTDLVSRALEAYDKGALSVSEVARVILNEMTLQSADEILLSIHGRVDILRELIALIRGWSAVRQYEDVEA